MTEFEPFPDYDNIGKGVYRKLRGLILTRELRWGERLSELMLSERLGVSRTPVREALRRLAGDGLVVMKPSSGTWIASPAPVDVLHVYELRAHLECMALRMAVENVTPRLLNRLEEKIELEAEIFRTRDIERYYMANRGFHTIIAGAGGNLFLARYVDDISLKTFVFSILCGKLFDFGTNPSLGEHRQILEAVRARDGDLCEKLIRAHLAITMEDLQGAEL